MMKQAVTSVDNADQYGRERELIEEKVGPPSPPHWHHTH